MNFVYVYVKLTDKAINGSTLYWSDYNDPEDWLIHKLKMTKNSSSGKWETTLQNLGDAGFDLVNVSPHQQESNGRFVKIENSYIFKRKDEIETTDLSQ